MSDVSKIIIAPIAIQSVGMDQWTLYHAMVKDLCKFDEQTSDNSGKLKAVQLANLSTTDADVLCVILRHLLLQEHHETASPPDTFGQVPQETEAENYSRPRLARHRPGYQLKALWGIEEKRERCIS
jgi:hypothetical protein